jgi:hypothetical protein
MANSTTNNGSESEGHGLTSGGEKGQANEREEEKRRKEEKKRRKKRKKKEEKEEE